MVPVHAYDRAVVNHHAELLAHVQRTGTKRGVHDLVIAATARAAERTVLTADERAHFGELPGAARIISN